MAAVLGVSRIRRRLVRLPAAVMKEMAKANQKSGSELIRLAKVLIPTPTGTNRAAITGTANADGSYLCDFGPKAKVIEENVPFVNPALSVTRKRIKSRAKRAMNKGIKAAFGHG